MKYLPILLLSLGSAVSASRATTAQLLLTMKTTKPLVIARINPVTHAGSASNHAFLVHGGNGLAYTMNDTAARLGTCTTTSVKNDRSDYFVPELYFHGKDGYLTSVPSQYMQVFYL